MTLCTTFEDYTNPRPWYTTLCRRTFLSWDRDECLDYAPSKSGVCALDTERCDLVISFYGGLCVD